VVHAPELHLYTCDESLLEHHHAGHAERVSQNHHGEHAVGGLVLHRCTCAVHELVLHHDVSDLALHRHDGRVVRVNQSRRDVRDLLVHRHDGHAERELVLHRCTCAVRELDDHLRNGRGSNECLMVFRHLCAAVYRKDSKHHCCALRHELQRAVIRRGCEPLDREVHEVREIRL
jgi:hypothetical protein